MSGRRGPRSQPQVSFKNESDSDSESGQRSQSRGRNSNNNNNGGNGGARRKDKPEKPRAAPAQNVSWFLPIVQTGKQELRFARGEGVPISQGVDTTYQHGYWLRRQRTFNKGGKQVQANPRWFFYYTGTGPYEGLRYGSRNNDLIWVGNEGANVNRLGDMGTRNPANDAGIPVQLAEGIPKGFYAEGRNSRGNSRNSSRSSSRGSSNANSRNQSRSNSPGRGSAPPSGGEPWMAYLIQKLENLEQRVDGKKSDKQPVKVTKNVASENAKKLRHKRTAHKGSNVTMNYGRRGPGNLEGNFGDQEFCKLGTDDPRFPVVAQMAPNSSSFVFMSHFAPRYEADALWLDYTGSIKLPRDDPNFPQWEKLLAENIDAYKSFPPPKPKSDKKKKFDKSDSAAGPSEDLQMQVVDPSGVQRIYMKDAADQTDDEWLQDDTIYEDENDKPKAQRRQSLKKRNANHQRHVSIDGAAQSSA